PCSSELILPSSPGRVLLFWRVTIFDGIYKLGIRFQSDAMVRRFLASGRTGFCLAVQREGNMAAGDEITVLARDPHKVPVGAITRLYVEKTFGAEDIEVARNAMGIAALPDSWKAHLRARLATA